MNKVLKIVGIVLAIWVLIVIITHIGTFFQWIFNMGIGYFITSVVSALIGYFIGKKEKEE